MIKATVKGFETHTVEGFCRCCGFVPESEPPFTTPFLLWKAGISDGDGVYYAALCGQGDGTGGCLEDILTERARNKREGGAAGKRQSAADFVAGLQGDDTDAAEVEVEDARAMGMLDQLMEE